MLNHISKLLVLTLQFRNNSNVPGNCWSNQAVTGVGTPNYQTLENYIRAQALANETIRLEAKIDAIKTCFSGESLVWTSQDTQILLADVKVGDYILTATGFEQVLFFLHRSSGTAAAAGRFLQIEHQSSGGSAEKHVVEASPGHLLYKADGRAVRAADLRLGDVLIDRYMFFNQLNLFIVQRIKIYLLQTWNHRSLTQFI